MPPTRRRDAAAERHLANVLGMVSLDLETRIADAVTGATGLSTVQASALSALANYADGGSTEALRTAVGLSHSATVRLVDRLAEFGYVARGGGDADDRRVTTVHLTPAGRGIVGDIHAARTMILRDWVRRLSADEQAVLSAALDRAGAHDIAPAPEGAAAANYVCRMCDTRACGHPTRCPVTQAVRTHQH